MMLFCSSPPVDPAPVPAGAHMIVGYWADLLTGVLLVALVECAVRFVAALWPERETP